MPNNGTEHDLPRPAADEPSLPGRPRLKYARGADLSKVPLASDVAPVDLTTILNVDSSNPFLRALRIREGFLRFGDLPPEITARASSALRMEEGAK
jgi:hypothetical protein